MIWGEEWEGPRESSFVKVLTASASDNDLPMVGTGAAQLCSDRAQPQLRDQQRDEIDRVGRDDLFIGVFATHGFQDTPTSATISHQWGGEIINL